MKDASRKTETTIAIPCYADRVLPRFDQAHEFLLARVDLDKQVVTSKDTVISTAPTQRLVRWLAEQEVDGVLCSGIPQYYQIQLQQFGIWLIWGLAGELEKVLQQWLHNQQPAT